MFDDFRCFSFSFRAANDTILKREFQGGFHVSRFVLTKCQQTPVAIAAAGDFFFYSRLVITSGRVHGTLLPNYITPYPPWGSYGILYVGGSISESILKGVISFVELPRNKLTVLSPCP